MNVNHEPPERRRQIACIDACVGISTEQLESWVSLGRPIIACIRDLRLEADRASAQNDRLLKALQLYIRWIDAEKDHAGTDFFMRMQMCAESEDVARAAIAAATEEAE